MSEEVKQPSDSGSVASHCSSLRQFLRDRCLEASDKQDDIAARYDGQIDPEDATYAYWEGQHHCAASALREFRRLDSEHQWPCKPSDASEYWDGQRWAPIGMAYPSKPDDEQSSWNHRKRLRSPA